MNEKDYAVQIDKLRAEIARLTDENEAYKRMRMSPDTIYDRRDEKIAELTAALELFANENNWSKVFTYPRGWVGLEPPYEIARRALEKKG